MQALLDNVEHGKVSVNEALISVGVLILLFPPRFVYSMVVKALQEKRSNDALYAQRDKAFF
jgi:hypothetical protein